MSKRTTTVTFVIVFSKNLKLIIVSVKNKPTCAFKCRIITYLGFKASDFTNVPEKMTVTVNL